MLSADRAHYTTIRLHLFYLILSSSIVVVIVGSASLLINVLFNRKQRKQHAPVKRHTRCFRVISHCVPSCGRVFMLCVNQTKQKIGKIFFCLLQVEFIQVL